MPQLSKYGEMFGNVKCHPLPARARKTNQINQNYSMANAEHIFKTEETSQTETVIEGKGVGQRSAVETELGKIIRLETMVEGCSESEDYGQTEPKNEQPQKIKTEFTDFIESLKLKAKILANEKATKKSYSGEDLLKTYLIEIGKYPLLEKEEEVLLARCIEAGLNVGQSPDPEGIYVLKEAKEAKELFIKSNLRLVVSIATRYQRRAETMELLDLIQEGNLGLEHAVDKFDWRQSNKFSTYATWWITQAVNRGIDKSDKSIRLPSSKQDEVNKYSKTKQYLKEDSKGNADLTDENISKQMGVTIKKLNGIKEARRIQSVASLDSPLNDGDGHAHSLTDVISNPVASSDLDKVLTSLAHHEQVDQFVNILEPEERSIIECRYGLITGAHQTIKETSKILKISVARVRQVEALAFRKMRAMRSEVRFEE